MSEPREDRKVKTNEPVLGLRERKRRATENAIEEAAVHLALELGHTEVTVEAICERAFISRTTFFNYFPSREAAIVGRPIALLEGEAADAILDAFPRELALALILLVTGATGHAQVNGTVARGRKELMITQPGVVKYNAESEQHFRRHATATLYGWLIRHPEHTQMGPGRELREALLITGISAAAAEVLLAEDWGNEEGDAPMDLDMIRAIIAELHTLSTAV